MSVASSEVWQEGSWINALPYHPVFKNLSDELPNENDTPLLCESRGDIFIWNPSSWSMLTTNLKRLHAQRDESLIYQVSINIHVIRYCCLIESSSNNNPAHSTNQAPPIFIWSSSSTNWRMLC